MTIAGILLPVLILFLFGGQNSLSAQTTPELGIRTKPLDLKAFINARIVVSPEQTIDTGILVIKNGKVLGVGIDIDIPPDAEIIDLDGKSIYPGFIETVSDYGLEKDQPFRRDRNRTPHYYGDRTGGKAWNEAIHAEKNWSRFFRPSSKDSRELMELGFTIVQSAKLDGVFRGRSFVALLGDGLPNDLLLEPYGNHFASFNKGRSKQDYPNSQIGIIAMIRQMFYDVDWYKKAHQANSLNPGQKIPEFNSSIEALSNISNETIVFEGYENSHSVLRAARIADEFGYTFVHVAGGREYAWLDEIKACNATLIVPLNFPEPLSLKTPEDELDVTLSQLRHWETAPANAAKLEAKDIPFALTTKRLKDNKSFWENLRKAMKRGLSSKTALAALTTIPAGICGISDMAGTLEKGKLANFFICDGDVFDTSIEIYSVWVAGNKNEFKAIPTTEFEGYYQLVFAGNDFRLSLKGEPSKLSGKIKIGKWSDEVKSLSADRNRITFACKIDSVDGSKLVRFSGRKKNNEISGRCVLPDGETANWTASITEEEIEDAADSDSTDVENEESPEEESYYARLTYPNLPFGFESLPEEEDVIIKNATVWTAETDGILEDMDIIIKGGKFSQIGKDLEVSGDFTVIDAMGMHVTPGIIDAHSHICGFGDINEGTHAITPEVRIGDVINPESIDVYRQLAGGVTTSMILHGSANPVGGQNQTIKLRWGSNSEEMKFKEAAPTIKFALGENVKQSNWGDRFRTRYPQSRMGVEAILRDLFQAAKEYEQDWEKYNALSNKEQDRTIPPRKDLGLEAMVEVLNDDILVHCHSYMQAETLMLMRLAEDYGFTMDVFVHMLEGYKVADEMSKHGAMATVFSDWWAYKFEVYDAIPYNGKLLADRGVITSFNSDSPDLARRLNQEAGKAIMYGGMTPEEAIKLVTINAAIQLGADKYTGSIAVGKDADFVIWDKYPLSVYARAQQTWIDGKKYFDIVRDKQLRQELLEEKKALIQKVVNASGSKGGK